MKFSVCGFNHKTANLHDRERFQLGRASLTDAVSQYKELVGCEEAVIVATCNRVEFYRVMDFKSNHYQELIEFYRASGVENLDVLRDICYCRQGTTAARQLFRVAAGLDSLVLGEDQVLYQVKDAYSAACAVGGPGKILHKVFHLAFQAGKRVRNETNIASGPRSIPSAAMELLHKKMKDEPLVKALIIGVNNMTEIILENLTKKSIPVILANRTLYHAEKMAGGYGAEPAHLSDLKELIPQVNVIFTVASADEYIVNPYHVQNIAKSNRTLFIVDIAVPRNVNPETANIEGIKLLDLQDLKRHLDVTQAWRNADIPRAEALIEEQVSAYSLWRSKMESQAKLMQLRQALNDARINELEKVKSAFRKGDLKALEAFSSSIMREFLRLAPYLLDENDIELEMKPNEKNSA